MWCVLYARDGDEVYTEEFVSNLLPESIHSRCFHLTRDRMIKYSGKWHTVNETLLPGYVFVDTDEPEKVYEELKKTSRRLLFSNDEHVATLDEDEILFMNQLTGGGSRIAISTIRVRDDRTIEYLSGPLVNVADKVKRVDFHKRFAEVDAGFMGNKQVIRLGFTFDEQKNETQELPYAGRSGITGE